MCDRAVAQRWWSARRSRPTSQAAAAAARACKPLLVDRARTGRLAERGDRVDGGDALRQHGVGGQLGQLRGPQVGAQDAVLGHPVLVHAAGGRVGARGAGRVGARRRQGGSRARAGWAAAGPAAGRELAGQRQGPQQEQQQQGHRRRGAAPRRAHLASVAMAARPLSVSLPPISTRSGAVRSSMAVPSARNSGLDRISNCTLGSLQLRRSTCGAASERGREGGAGVRQGTSAGTRCPARSTPKPRSPGSSARLLNGVGGLDGHRGLLHDDLAAGGHAGNHARRALPVGQVRGLARAHAAGLGGGVHAAEVGRRRAGGGPVVSSKGGQQGQQLTGLSRTSQPADSWRNPRT